MLVFIPFNTKSGHWELRSCKADHFLTSSLFPTIQIIAFHLRELICGVFAACSVVVSHERAARHVGDDRRVVIEGRLVVGTIRTVG